MSDDKIISLANRIKQRNLESGDDWPDPIPLPVPTFSEVQAFVRILTFLQQQAPDGTGTITFDYLMAKIVLDGGRIDWDDDDPQIRRAVVTEALFPIAFTAFDEDDQVSEEEVTLQEIVASTHRILTDLAQEEGDDE